MSKPSASAVSRVLGAAGMTKSVSHTTRIRGWHSYEAGFRASTWKGIDHVAVDWVNGGFGRDDQSAVKMQEAADILTGKGYSVETVVNDIGRVSLKVTRPDEG